MGVARWSVQGLRRRLLGALRPAAAGKLRRGPHARRALCRAAGTGHDRRRQHRNGDRASRQRRRLRDAARRVRAEGAGGLDGQGSRGGHGAGAQHRQRALPRDGPGGRDTRHEHADAERAPVRRPGRSASRRRPRSWFRTRRSPPPTTTSGSATTPTRPPATTTAWATATPRRPWRPGRRPRSLQAARSRSDGTTFTWPDVPAGTPDNVVTAGQTVDVTGTGTDLGFLGASQNGTATGPVTINYKDGSSQSFNVNMADWYADAPAVGERARHHDLELELPVELARAAPGQHLLRVGAARARKDRELGHAPDPDKRRRNHRDAHLRDGHRDRNPDDGRAVLIARCRLRQRRDQRQLGSGRRQLRRYGRELLRAGARGRNSDRRSPPAARRRSAARRSPGRPPSAPPTT